MRNRLARVIQADAFIMSETLFSLLARAAENKDLIAIFDSLGSEIYLRPALDCFAFGQRVTLSPVVEAARRAEVSLGYRQEAFAPNPDTQYGSVLNPRKSDRVAFTERGRRIVAES